MPHASARNDAVRPLPSAAPRDCHVCGAPGAVDVVPAFATLRRVTSDCQPFEAGGMIGFCRVCGTVQKPVDAPWQAEARRIYEAYSIYHQGGGHEPILYVGGFARLVERSIYLFSSVLAELKLKAEGRMLDVGCGNGATLRTIGPLLANWTLEAHEIDDKYRTEVEAIPGVTEFHVGPIPAAPGRYDLVTLVHVIEHVPQPEGFLRRIADILAPDGVLLVLVPSVETNPFDLVVADHCTHFSRASLWRLLRRSGLDEVSVNDRWMTRQLAALARRGKPTGTEQRRYDVDLASVVGWLTKLREDASTCAAGSRFGIFGSSINAVWLAGELGDKVAFFVDEDESRVGRMLLGRPIVAPNAVSPGASVYVAMPPPWGADIANRLSTGEASYVTPPA